MRKDTAKALEATSKAAEKGLALIDNLYGQALKPKQMKKKADAYAYSINILSQAYRNNKDVPWVIDDDYKISIDNKEIGELYQRAQVMELAEKLIKQQNKETIACMAIEELQDTNEIPEGEVKHEWIMKFFENAANISNAEMQKIWAKLLAGEVKQPESFSLRTLEVLSKLSTSEAKLFETLSKFFLDGSYVYKKLEEYSEMNYESLLKLQDAGLIDLNPTTGIIPLKTKLYDAIKGNKKIIKIQNTSQISTSLFFETYLLTNAGKELLKIIKYQIDDDYLKLVAKHLKNKEKTLSITFHSIINENEFDDLDELED